MVIFNIFEIYDSFDHGTYENHEGSFSSLEKAQEAIATLIKQSTSTFTKKDEFLWKCDDCDQDSQYISIVECQMDELVNVEFIE